MAEENTHRTIEGTLTVQEGQRFAIVATRFNAFVVEHLLQGAVDAFVRHGARAENITVVRIPGSWEMPLVCRRLAQSGQFDAIVAASAVIRGATAHFDYVAGGAAKGVAQVSLETGVPVANAMLTTDTIEQAVERAGTKAGNKGFDAAVAAIEMANLARSLQASGL